MRVVRRLLARLLIVACAAAAQDMKTLARLSRVYWYKSSENYAKWAAETFKRARALLQQLGLAAK